MSSSYERQDLRKTDIDYTVLEKTLIAICTFIIFAFVGITIRIFVSPIDIRPLDAFIADLMPMSLFVGIPAGILSYFFPQHFGVFYLYFPGIGNREKRKGDW